MELMSPLRIAVHSPAILTLTPLARLNSLSLSELTHLSPLDDGTLKSNSFKMAACALGGSTRISLTHIHQVHPLVFISVAEAAAAAIQQY